MVKPGSLEETVQSLWQTIIVEWFPARDGYKYGFKAATLANRNQPDISVIQINALVPNPRNSNHFDERQILLVECKRPSLDTPRSWNDTLAGQLHDDLAQNINSSNRLFGAVAIGKKVKFYQFDGNARQDHQVSELHHGTFDMGDPNGVTQVERMMDYIKSNGWRWACSPV